ncbi:MAG: UDP-2,3-diacylglucosamine diphosphatase [Chromatiales bacterium]
MPETLFISDLHLEGDRPVCTQLFLGFLSDRARSAERLYILGDLFDAWVGDDDRRTPVPEILEGLQALSEAGTEVLFQHGNRDFLVGEAFARETGCRLIGDPLVVDLYGTPTLLMHGDLLCTDDVDYQRARGTLRDPAFIRDFLARPVAERVAIAAEYRRRSGEATSMKPEDIMDVNEAAVREQMTSHGVRRLIHGHTHRPGSHRVDLDGVHGERIVLGDWRADRAPYLRVDASGWEAARFTP